MRVHTEDVHGEEYCPDGLLACDGTDDDQETDVTPVMGLCVNR